MNFQIFSNPIIKDTEMIMLLWYILRVCRATMCMCNCVCVCVCLCVFMSFHWGGLFLWKMIKIIYISMHLNDVILYQPLSSLFLDLCYFTPKDKIPTILLTGKNITCDVWRSTVMKEFIYIYTTYDENIRKIERLLWSEFFHSGSSL